MKRLAYLAPEIPSVSATFVFREILSLEAQFDVEVVPFSLHPVNSSAIAEAGRELGARTRVLYSSRARLAVDAAVQLVRSPLGSARAMARLGRDFLRGRTNRRLRLLPQGIAGLALARQLRAAGCEHLHVHFAHSPGSVGMIAARAADLPFSITAHANDLFVHRQLLEEKIHRARPFVTISEWNRRHLMKEHGPLPRSIEIVRCGADTSRFEPRSPLGPREGLFCVARLVPKKGVDLLIRALAQLPESVHCAIAGDGPERERLESLARTLGLGHRVEFLGAVDDEQIRDGLDRARAFVLPCRRPPGGDVDGIPVALMEAMAKEVPVVSTQVSGIPELIESGVTGSLAEPDDLPSLVRALEDVLDDPERALDRAREGRIRVRARFDLHRNAARLGALLQLETRHGPVSQGESQSPQPPPLGAA